MEISCLILPKLWKYLNKNDIIFIYICGRMHGRTQRGAGECHGSPLNLWEKIFFSLYGKIKTMNIKEGIKHGGIKKGKEFQLCF